MPEVKIKRIYEPYAPADGLRLLVDGIWPRGITKDQARIDLWARELAPSGSLRKWFSHRQERWPEFQRRYREELSTSAKKERLQEIIGMAQTKQVTLVYAARDQAYNNAVVLRDVANDWLRKGQK